jgi:hypothetical protein
MVGPPPPGVRVAQPGELPTPTQFNMPGYQPGTPRMWQPNLPPYDPEQALKQQGLATTALGVASDNETVRAIENGRGHSVDRLEMDAATVSARRIQAQGGQGTVAVGYPRHENDVGSPQLHGDERREYPTYARAASAAAAKAG